MSTQLECPNNAITNLLVSNGLIDNTTSEHFKDKLLQAFKLGFEEGWWIVMESDKEVVK